METSLFGLSTGSYMVNYGGTNTAYAAPSILAQTGGYTSAVFHGNTDPSGIVITPINNGGIITSLTHQPSLKKLMKTHSSMV